MKKLFFLFAALVMAAVVMAQTPTVSASKVTMKYCKTTYGSITIHTNAYPANRDGFSFPSEGTYVRKITNARGCDSVVTYTFARVEGGLNGAFSVASNKRVTFSRGNLQFCANPSSGPKTHTVRGGGSAAGVWRFAEHQYDVSPCTANTNRGSSSSAWQDIFARGASGASINPWDYTNPSYCGSMIGNNYDWGVYNAISNGENTPGIWRCLTKDEWKYLLGHYYAGSNNVQSASPCRSGARSKWGWGTITIGSEVHTGVIILPDSWTLPSGCSFVAVSSSPNNSPTVTNYSASQWAAMEANGAVFLPVEGYYQSSCKVEAGEAYYHTAENQDGAPGLWGFDNMKLLHYSSACSDLKACVRLVTDCQ